MNNDPVNQPSHYQSELGIECIDAIRAAVGDELFVGFCRANAMKYLWRTGKKDDALQDLRKAETYLMWAVEASEGKELSK
jgi:hypothetical protein